MAEKIAGWRHSGLNFHSRLRAQTKKEGEYVGKYMTRPLLALERLSFHEKEAKVSYRYGKESEEEEQMDYLAVECPTLPLNPAHSLNSEDPVFVLVKAVAAHPVFYIQKNQNTGGHANGEASDVDKGIDLVPLDVSQGNF